MGGRWIIKAPGNLFSLVLADAQMCFNTRAPFTQCIDPGKLLEPSVWMYTCPGIDAGSSPGTCLVWKKARTNGVRGVLRR